jgi:Mg2+/Co2+ transporter CorB
MATEILITTGVIVVLLVLSAFFSGSETALTAASHPRLHELARQGNARAKSVNALIARKERLIGALLLGNNLVNIAASALATSLLIDAFASRGVLYATLIMTFGILIFAEVLPKTYAIHYPVRVALVVAPIIRAIVFALAPVVRAVQGVVTFTLRLFGVRIDDQRSFTAGEEELRGAIELHQGPDAEARDERRMLRSILDLADVDVDEVLTHRSGVEMIDADAPIREIVEVVLASPYTRLPVWRSEPDNVVGVIHTKALFLAVQKADNAFDELDIKKIWSAPWFIPESTSLLDQLREFRRRHEHFALVVDEYGALLGVVTLEDILEEIVGEIEDEHDRAAPGIGLPGVRSQEDGSYIVDGRVTLRDLNREFEWELPDEEASTIAGLVMHEARRIPETGQVFAFHGFRFEILRRRKNRLASLRMSRIGKTGAESSPRKSARKTKQHQPKQPG